MVARDESSRGIGQTSRHYRNEDRVPDPDSAAPRSGGLRLKLTVFGQVRDVDVHAACSTLRELGHEERVANTDRLVKAIRVGHYLNALRASLRAAQGHGYFEIAVNDAGIRPSTARQRMRLAALLGDESGNFNEVKYRELERQYIEQTGEDSSAESPEPYLQRALVVCGIERARTVKAMQRSTGSAIPASAPDASNEASDDDIDMDEVEAALEKAYGAGAPMEAPVPEHWTNPRGPTLAEQIRLQHNQAKYTTALAGATPPGESYAGSTLSEANGPTASVRSDPRGYHHEAGEGRPRATAHLPQHHEAAAPVNRDGGRRPIDYSTAHGAAVQLTFESVYEEARRFGDEIAELLSKITTMPPDVARQVHESIGSLRALLRQAGGDA